MKFETLAPKSKTHKKNLATKLQPTFDPNRHGKSGPRGVHRRHAVHEDAHETGEHRKVNLELKTLKTLKPFNPKP
jgi:hypothetical protein